MIDPTTINELAAALSKAQGEMTGAKKDSVNPHFKNSYADLASVLEAIRVPFAKHGLSVVQLLHTVEGGVEAQTILLHSSGQNISASFTVPVGQPNAQGYGSASTYAKRYSLMAMVGVAGVDDDGEAASIGAPGQAGGGGDFRPPGPRRFRSAGNMTDEAERDGTLDTTRAKGTLAKQNVAQTPDEKKATKVKAAVDKRIDALKSQSTWTRAELDDFWRDNKTWIDWMADPTNAVLPEYERFTNAFADAEMKIVEA